MPATTWRCSSRMRACPTCSASSPTRSPPTNSTRPRSTDPCSECSPSRHSTRVAWGSKRPEPGEHRLFLEVVVHPEVRDLLLAHHPAQRVLELRLLDEQVVLGIQAGRDLR